MFFKINYLVIAKLRKATFKSNFKSIFPCFQAFLIPIFMYYFIYFLFAKILQENDSLQTKFLRFHFSIYN